MQTSLELTPQSKEIPVLAISPALQDVITQAVKTFNELKEQRTAIDEIMELAKQNITLAMIEAGIAKMRVDGTPVAYVTTGKSSRLDKVKFVELGGSLSILAAATVTKPKKPFLQIGAEKEEKSE
jgi:hypothetical protein